LSESLDYPEQLAQVGRAVDGRLQLGAQFLRSWQFPESGGFVEAWWI
jgi:hypothetical protein